MVVEDERITVIGVVPEGFVCDKIFDVEGKYLLPGIIDCHAHVTMVGGDHHMAVFFSENTAELTMEGVINSEWFLMELRQPEIVVENIWRH